ncbi:MAG: anti-sigma factor [Candidatus Halalkalibacterium sp. M3_1C_030]
MAKDLTNKEKFEELCAGYVLNALEPEEREEFEKLLQDASDKERELFHQMQSAANQIAFSVQENQAPEAVRERILDQVKTESKDDDTSLTGGVSAGSEDSNNFDRTTFAIAASFALLLVTLSLVFYSFNLSTEISSKEEIIEEQQARITELQNDVQQKEELLSILESREVDLVMMSGMEVNPNGYGKIIWDSEANRALLQVSNLPAVPSDKDYQLWIIKNNKPVSAGVFAVNDPQKDSFFKIEEMAASEQAADAFAITMEPKGGMPQPTGDMYLMGNMNKN